MALINIDPKLRMTRADSSARMLATVLRLCEGQPYVMVHDDPDRPILVPDHEQDVRVMHVDDKRFRSDIVFDYIDVLKNALHVHAIDSSIALLVDIAKVDTMMTVHAYARAPGSARNVYGSSVNVIHQPPVMGRYNAHLFPTSNVGRALTTNFRHFAALQDIMAPTKAEWYPCGSYLMSPDSMAYDPSMHDKQMVLFEAAKGRRNALEIGVHGGHSLLMILLASPECHVTCVDLCGWRHTEKCVEYLQAQFPGRITLLKGDSKHVLPLIQDTYDFIHIDGEHTFQAAKFDMEQSVRLSHEDSVIVIDDFCGDIARALETIPEFRVVALTQCAWGNCVVRRIS